MALLVGLLAWHYHTRPVTLNPAARDAVRSWVAAQYQPAVLGPRALAPQLDSAVAAAVLHEHGVEIRFLTARGRIDNAVVRVETAVLGGAPADGRPVRYYRLLHLAQSGGRVVGESTALRYHTRVW